MEGLPLKPSGAESVTPAIPWPGVVTLHLARKRRTVSLAPGQNLLTTLLRAGVHIRHACHSGGCGACQLRVLDGIPLHRDPELAGRQPAPQDRIRPCVSLVASAELTLDL